MDTEMGLWERVTSLTKLVVGLSIVALSVVVHSTLLLLLFPFRTLRIKSCNYYGKLLGPTMMWVAGCPLTFVGTEHLDPQRPALYVSNHTSIVDIFLAIWLSPVGTVGVAKKQVVYYPFFGQLYWLSGHLRIDRANTRAALRSFDELRQIVNANGLSIYLWPEGTRSRDGHLLRFRKGVVHLAKQTGLPIVPVVVSGAHRVWEKATLRIRKAPITVTVLPAIDTSDWELDTIADHLQTLERAFSEVLPQDQQPRPVSAAA